MQKSWMASTTFANKHQLVYVLGDDLAQGISLQFSRYATNSALERCLKGLPTPCDETQTYEMVLYAPIGQQSFQGGTWPAAPVGALLLAGGRTTNTALFKGTGARCPNPTQTIADDFCPLQPLIQFKPLCGGTVSSPNLTVAGGGPCTGPATGFDITVGVARYFGGNLIFHNNTSPGGDAQVYRFPATILNH